MRKGDDTRPGPIDTNKRHDPGSGLRSDGEPFYTLTRVIVRTVLVRVVLVSAGLWLVNGGLDPWWYLS